MLDYEGSSTELVGSSGAELRHNPLIQLKTRFTCTSNVHVRKRQFYPLDSTKTLRSNTGVYSDISPNSTGRSRDSLP
jgi:hypothetical protein